MGKRSLRPYYKRRMARPKNATRCRRKNQCRHLRKMLLMARTLHLLRLKRWFTRWG